MRPERNQRIQASNSAMNPATPDALPVPRVEELLLEQAEEALGAGVVAAHALARHAPGQPVRLADRDPPRPAVVAAAVAVDGRRLAGRQHPAGRLERGIGQPRRGVPADRPRDGPAVEAVDDGRQVALRPAGQPELRDVGDPQLVGGRGAEVVRPVLAQRQVRLGGGRLPGVAAPPAAAAPPRGEPLLAHQPADHLLGDADAAAPQLRVDGPVAACYR